jgi:hypothetical protein
MATEVSPGARRKIEDAICGHAGMIAHGSKEMRQGALDTILAIAAPLLSAAVLLPAESMAVTVARAQLERGDNPTPNTTALLLATLDRLTGREDWRVHGIRPDGSRETLTEDSDA